MKTLFILHCIILVLPLSCNAQFLNLKGSIIDSHTGMYIDEVNIFESNSGIGTISNDEGFFSLMLYPGEISLVISYEDYKTVAKNMILKSDSTLKIKLIPDVNLKSKHKSIDEVQVMNTEKKK